MLLFTFLLIVLNNNNWIYSDRIALTGLVYVHWIYVVVLPIFSPDPQHRKELRPITDIRQEGKLKAR